MPRFQLLVREPGKEPRCVPIGDPIIVGRARSVDVTVDDEEVGRKQFRIGVTSGFVVLEGLGATNPTRLDDSVIKPGEKTTLPPGARILVGRTVFVVEAVDSIEDRPPTPPEAAEKTMVGRPEPSELPGAPQTARPPTDVPPADVPMNTMDFQSPGRPGRAPPGAPPAAPPADAAPMNTMDFRPPGLARSASDQPRAPGQPNAPGQPASPPPETGAFDQTMAKGFRPGSPGAAPTPPRAATPKPQPPAPKAALPAPQAPPATPAAPAPAGLANRPKTVAVRPEGIAPPATTTAAADDLESLLHQAAPRLFVKGEGLKRPVRLMKVNSRIGRAETADVQLPHESVSEQHAELSFDGTNWTLLDSGSTNGCVVDGQHLRSSAQIVRRNSLISIGSLHLIFLCVSKETAGQDRRDEARALRLLTKGGRLDKTTANEIRQMMRAEASHSIAEIVLRDTQLTPVDWANAVATARRKVSFFARIMRLFTGSK